MKFAYFAAVSVAVIAQAASAQAPKEPGDAKNQVVTLKSVHNSTERSSVILQNGAAWYWRHATVEGATISGRAVKPAELKQGMRCVLNGARIEAGNFIGTLAC